ncbi:lysophospholipase [Nocardia otitidiscaviarum]|uniref:alpha/beta hydrolase n=1 Tax=Nocardia otitidiscaviarum TaxID=1823 RepID=UPI0004A75C88|nr:alpha/beta hydrolase [Nocardia otitidiscaviarum]MBF6134830.1 lysophospholipase [Nocardia otitidiscaviarum]MBF6485544.1 lysophospholipase [Nocardia otitidiscaviarum]
MTTTETGEFDGKGGRIFWRAWLPDTEPRAVAVIVHGIAEHSGRYEHVGQRLADAGIAAYALDHIGHGQSAGGKANIESMENTADNVETMLGLATERHPELSRFVIGHSMGGLITSYLATRAPLDVTGIVLSAAAIEIEAGNPIQRMLGPLVSRFAPNLGVLKLDSTLISRDPAVVHAYNTDPLVYTGPVVARTGAEMLEATVRVKERLSVLTAPLLVLQGTADGLVAPTSADVLEKGVGSEDLTVIRYDGLYHEVFNEPEQDKVLGDLLDWLEARL